MKISRVAGTTNEILQIFIRDSSSTTGAGLTGLVFNSASLTAYYKRNDQNTATSIALVTATVGTYTSGGFVQIDATNMPGWYELHLPSGVFTSGRSAAIHLKGATNMAPLPIEVEITSVDNQSATFGLGALSLISAYDFAKGTVAMTESYAAKNAALTPAQALYMINQQLGQQSISGTTMTVKKRDQSTTAKTYTLDSAVSPTSITEAS